jgi:hypothetical protein
MHARSHHTIVSVRDDQESATLLAPVLGVAPPRAYRPLLVPPIDDDISLDFSDDHGPAYPRQDAFLVAGRVRSDLG